MHPWGQQLQQFPLYSCLRSMFYTLVRGKHLSLGLWWLPWKDVLLRKKRICFSWGWHDDWPLLTVEGEAPCARSGKGRLGQRGCIALLVTAMREIGVVGRPLDGNSIKEEGRSPELSQQAETYGKRYWQGNVCKAQYPIASPPGFLESPCIIPNACWSLLLTTACVVWLWDVKQGRQKSSGGQSLGTGQQLPEGTWCHYHWAGIWSKCHADMKRVLPWSMWPSWLNYCPLNWKVSGLSGTVQEATGGYFSQRCLLSLPLSPFLYLWNK